MRVVDVNVLVYAHRRDSTSHEAYRAWLDEARDSDEPLGISGMVLSSFVRIVTNRRVYAQPTPLEVALAFAGGLRGSPSARSIEPGERNWQVFIDLCSRADATGNLVPDAYLAALAIEHGATLVTADRGFGRFPGLRWRHPLDPVDASQR